MNLYHAAELCFGLPRNNPTTARAKMRLPPFVSTPPICRSCVIKVESHADAAHCVFADQARPVLSRFLGSRVAMGDEITFRSTLYQILHISPNAYAADLRVAFRLHDPELTGAGARRGQQVMLERAFNLVGQPELRAFYETLLADPEAPCRIPYGGFGSLLVAGAPSRDGETFYARRILSFHRAAA